MTLLEFIYADENLLFTIALSVMLIIAILEGITTLFGVAISSLIETLIPDFSMQIDTPETPQGVLSRLFSWLNIGKVPVLIIFISFLTAFSLIGYSIQYSVYSMNIALLPQLIGTPISFFIALPFVKFFTSLLQKIMPKDESSALTKENFIGTVATITLGTSKFGSPAQAKYKDTHGQMHYFMVEPESNEYEFTQGEEVLLSKHKESGYFAIKNTLSSLKGN